jgi:hypothetical protein
MGRVLTGKWKWNDVINPMDAGDRYMQHDLWVKSGFTSNGQKFDSIRFTYDKTWKLEYGTGSSFVTTGAGYSEEDYATPFEQYRVIDFGTESEVDDDSDGTFVAWFLSNVTRYGTVADKLVQIAENEKAVYQSGYDKALEKGGYNGGFEAGKEAERDAFWDAYMPEIIPNSQYLFYSPRWNDANFYPNKDIKPTGPAPFAFSSHYITNFKQRLIDCGAKLDTSKITSGNYMFCYCNKLTHLPTISFVGLTGSISNAFDNNPKMVEIEKIILKDDGSTTFSHWFDKCAALTTSAFEGVIGNNINFQWSTLLTNASIESIINHLSDTATGKTLTLSLTAVDNAYGWYLPNGSFVGGSNSGPWGSLEASKPNWTINLV